jgi:hypothetical protein
MMHGFTSFQYRICLDFGDNPTLNLLLGVYSKSSLLSLPA